MAQDEPPYGGIRVEELREFGASLNPGCDEARAGRDLRRWAFHDQRLGRRFRVAIRVKVGLALAVGRGPDLLILDQPVANLDPLARGGFLAP